jgi:hypothetical protein
MREVTIKINLENDESIQRPLAFLALYVKRVASKLKWHADHSGEIEDFKILDSNGNSIGEVTFHA